MSLSASDLLSPVGDLEPEMFPSDEGAVLKQRLNAYLAEGYLKVEGLAPERQDEPAKHWAYYRAYKSIFIRLSATPALAALTEEGSRSYTVEQVARFGRLAEESKANFEKLAAVNPPTTSVAPNQTRSIRTVPRW